ncbi:MAG: hypothetical protein NUW01_16490 [Gemmatimonadaceae bacterium]|nr:hypothetical protein [Gemmatimonadaceae bacterium]
MTANSPAGAPTVRIYIDARPVDAESGATPLSALERHDRVAAALVREGSRVIVDNRGLPAPLDEPVANGSIFRVVSSRQAS